MAYVVREDVLKWCKNNKVDFLKKIEQVPEGWACIPVIGRGRNSYYALWSEQGELIEKSDLL